MSSYVMAELPALVQRHFPATDRRSVFGHSMGGYGALSLALRHPGAFQSVSAFSPIVAPCQVPWGQKAFAAYLGADRSTWEAHDPCELVRSDLQERLPLLVDQGDADSFLAEQLRPELLQAACADVGYPLELRIQPGYDHSYYFIASFMRDHVAHHARALVAAG
jgi:S-formylglutathione hydrolase